jgi:Putative DNA-binding domain
MSFETTVRAFAAALDDPAAAAPAMTHGRMGAPDARRFAVYRNNVAVGLIGALEARYPVCRRIAGDGLFRAMARAFVRAHKPRSPVMIAYGGEFPAFAAAYLVTVQREPVLNQIAPEFRQGPSRRVSSPLAGEEQGGGWHGLMRLGTTSASDNLPGPRDPPPLPAPTRGGGCANAIESAGLYNPIAALVDVARLENAWVEAYHAEDAIAGAVGDLAALSPDCLPGTRIAFHPGARLLRFATPAASIWASAQGGDQPPAPTEGAAEDALITRPDCDVRVRVLPPFAYDFALSLREGATLVEAVAALDDPAFDFGAHLVGLVASGAVASIIPGRPS